MGGRGKRHEHGIFMHAVFQKKVPPGKFVNILNDTWWAIVVERSDHWCHNFISCLSHWPICLHCVLTFSRMITYTNEVLCPPSWTQCNVPTSMYHLPVSIHHCHTHFIHMQHLKTRAGPSPLTQRQTHSSPCPISLLSVELPPQHHYYKL